MVGTAQTEAKIQPASSGERAEARQVVHFGFYRLDPAWRRLPRPERLRHSDELVSAVATHAKRLMALTYSLIGLKSDVDFLVWSVGKSLEELQGLSAAIRQTQMAGYLSMPYAYLSMTKRSTYVDKLDPDHQDRRRFITPFHSKYLFVYPFVKTWDWYALPFEQRQAMMDEHVVLGNKYPSVRIHTTYAFGLDDPEFVLAFESDHPQDFLDLVMEMRESKARRYTLRDTPIFTCVAQPMQEIVKGLGV